MIAHAKRRRADAVLVTERLTLREMQAADLDFLSLMLADPEVMRHYPRCYTRREAEGWLARQQQRYVRHGHGLWLVEERSTGRPLGQIGLLEQEVEGEVLSEIGYLLHRSYWGKGFATEGALGVRDLAFQRLGRRRVISLIRPANLPSRAVAARLGMKAERSVSFAGFEHLVYSVAREATA